MLHLFHPALVHFTVAFSVAGGLLEAWGRLREHETLTRRGSELLLVGLVSFVPTLITGYLAANTVSLPRGGDALLDTHELAAWALFLALFATQFWKAWCGGELGPTGSRVYAVLLLVLVAGVGWVAWLGGRMVYGYGIGVL